MSRSKDYYLWEEDSLREEYGIPEDEEIDSELFDRPMRPFTWFADDLDSETASEPAYEYDVFISYASERRSELVEPLVSVLSELGVLVWFDQDHEIHHPDRSINPAIPRSRVGVAVVSPEYLEKRWTVYELEAFLAIGTAEVLMLVYGLSSDGLDAVRLWARDGPADAATLTVIEMKSPRVKGVARRIRAAVRRAGADPPRRIVDRTHSQTAKGLARQYERTLPPKPRWHEGIREEDLEIVLDSFTREERNNIMGYVEEDEWGRIRGDRHGW